MNFQAVPAWQYQFIQQQQAWAYEQAQRQAQMRAHQGAEGGRGGQNFMMLFKLTVLVFLLAQGGSPERVFLLSVIAFVIYL